MAISDFPPAAVGVHGSQKPGKVKNYPEGRVKVGDTLKI